jgi:hypothetical protein
MTNVLGNYNPTFFANESLIQLFNQLGMAGRVYRGLDDQRTSAGNNKGDVINLKRPSKFTAATHVAGTGTTAQDVVGQNVQVTLDQHQEVKFAITDKELAYTSEKIIDEHIKPAAFALAEKIDNDLYTLGAKVGPKTYVSGAVASTFITGPRKILRNNAVPMDNNIHYMIDTGMEAAFLDLGIFSAADTTGQGNNTDALMQGTLGRRFGVETFTSQNADVTATTMTSTATASTAGGDRLGAVNVAVAANLSTIAVDGMTGSETLKIGDTFTIAGDTTIYILTADTTLSGGAGSLTFYPPLRQNAANDAVVTFDILYAIQEAAHYRNLMFHRNAFALGFAPLPTTGDGRGAEIATVTDPVSGLSVRARMYYNGDTATNSVALDVLYGCQVLDPMLGVRVVRATTVAPAA